MSLPLKDFRLGISESIARALECESAGFGKEQQEIAREVLQAWADSRHQAYRVWARKELANGPQTELPGFETGDDGSRRRGRK